VPSFLNALDTWLFLVINGLHNRFFDVVMFWASEKLTWIPVYILFIYFIIKYYHKQSWIIFISAAVLITLSDQVSVVLFKNIFHRLRPCHQADLAAFIHLVNGKCGGQYGFISSHAANFFALATFLSAFLKDKFKYFKTAVFFWASFIAYSRIYLGVHFPGDVVIGAITGILIGKIVVMLCHKTLRTYCKPKPTEG